MSKNNDPADAVVDELDRVSRDLSLHEYMELLEELISNLESRLTAAQKDEAREMRS